MKTKKIIFTASMVFLAVIVLCCTVFISILTYVNQYIKDNYHRRISIWQDTAGDIADGSIVFVGDSHTEYFALDEYFQNFPVINRGIYGDTTKGVINRLNESVLNLNPSKIFLLIGVNDINKTGETNEAIVENIREIIKRIRNVIPDVKIYVQSLYPVNKYGKNSRRTHVFKLDNKRIIAINQLLESFCSSEHIVYIDMFSRLTDKNGELYEEFTIEGLHLNAAGYRFIAEILRPYVEN